MGKQMNKEDHFGQTWAGQQTIFRLHGFNFTLDVQTLLQTHLYIRQCSTSILLPVFRPCLSMLPAVAEMILFDI